MHDGGGANDVAAECCADGLVAEADAEKGYTPFDGVDEGNGDACVVGGAGSGGDDDAVGGEAECFVDGEFVVAADGGFFTGFADVLDQVVGEGVVVVDYKNHPCGGLLCRDVTAGFERGGQPEQGFVVLGHGDAAPCHDGAGGFGCFVGVAGFGVVAAAPAEGWNLPGWKAAAEDVGGHAGYGAGVEAGVDGAFGVFSYQQSEELHAGFVLLCADPELDEAVVVAEVAGGGAGSEVAP